MIIYQNNTGAFVESVRNNRIADLIKDNFIRHSHYPPSESEYNSWANSLSRVRDLVELAGLTDNHIAVEYEVPYNQSRIDCLLFGRNGTDNNVVLIELKQWSEVKASDDEGNFVETYTGGRVQTVPHPSQQVKGYHNYVLSYVAEFEASDPLKLHSLAYCHNYKRRDGSGLHAGIYENLLREFPLYTMEDTRELAERLKQLLAAGKGTELFNRFMLSAIRPSRKLLDSVTRVIRNESVFSLIDDQLVAKNLIWSRLRKDLKNNTKSVIIVQGGPGTGKSVIALNVLAEAASRGHKVYWGCKSAPFRKGIQKLVGADNRYMFDNLYRYIPSRMKENEADVLFVDEAHRIEKSSNHQYTKPQDRSDMPQVEQLVRCARTAVFFIDDRQAVRNAEIGRSDVIREAACKYGAEVREVSLRNQFRCMGSNDYLEWLNFVLGLSGDERRLRPSNLFDFRIFDSPGELYEELEKKEAQKENSARLTAGFCWPWSKRLDRNGDLVKDVAIGDFAMPWETHGDISPVPKGYVSWEQWAIRPEGFKQVGCIYTAQGFEFDYVGVIFADDLRYDPGTGRLAGNKEAHRDPTLLRGKDEEFDTYVRNIYRVLMSRGLKGCYVYFVNQDTREFFEDQRTDV